MLLSTFVCFQAQPSTWTQQTMPTTPAICPTRRHPIHFFSSMAIRKESPERLVNASRAEEEQSFELKLRPRYLREFIGQNKAKEQLEIALQAAKSRGEALDHVLLFGPP